MSRSIFAAAGALGMAVILWTGWSFWGSNPLAFVVTLLIGAVYVAGAAELAGFRRANSTLPVTLVNIPADLTSLDDWLKGFHPSLQNAVRARIEGERVVLPGPVFTPYLAGLLVMLGLLGTFLGMVATLKGAVFALETTTDLQAIRSGLTAPIKGLGMAFGTSVAGVAASAMLGLMSAFCRRERQLATALLDTRIAGVLRPFSLAHNRQETFRALQFQARALPDLVEKLGAMAGQMERMGQHLSETLISSQQQFHQNTQALYTGLATSVEKSLRDNLSESAHLAGQVLQPVMADAVKNIQQETRQTQQHFNATATQLLSDQAQHDKQRLAVWSQQFENLSSALLTEWRAAGEQSVLQQQKASASLENTATAMVQKITQLLAASETLVHTRIESEQHWLAEHSTRMRETVATVQSALSTLRDEEAQRGRAAVERLADLQADVAGHLASLGAALEQPMTRLIQTAAEAPQAAADVIVQLRREMSNQTERDTVFLEERHQLAGKLAALLEAVQSTAATQQEAVESLVQNSADKLQQISAEFSRRVNSDTTQMTHTAAQVTASAADVSGLSETLGFAVELFCESSRKITDQLARVEEAFSKSSTRSDEQLAYYVAQAREIIDLSMLSQKEVFEELRRLSQPGLNQLDKPVAQENRVPEEAV